MLNSQVVQRIKDAITVWSPHRQWWVSGGGPVRAHVDPGNVSIAEALAVWSPRTRHTGLYYHKAAQANAPAPHHGGDSVPDEGSVRRKAFASWWSPGGGGTALIVRR